jgi:N-acetylglucosaminyldiphosphoundecaprenol N-acetyl-beta-D-mannosaminyltransferase
VTASAEDEHWTAAPPRVDVLGVGVSAVDPAGALDVIAGWIENRERHYVCVTGVHGVMESRRDPALRWVHDRSGLTVPDGMPLVWACRHAGRPEAARVYGPDLTRALCRAAAERGWRVFFYGSAPEVLESLVATLCDEAAGLTVAGVYSPPFRDLSAQERREAVARINATAPDIVFVGLGTPKQERWMAENREALAAPVILGVGAAFDLVPGLVPQAPSWMQRAGLEWLFRMIVEPRRLWKRYALNNPAFVLAIARRPPRLRP